MVEQPLHIQTLLRVLLQHPPNEGLDLVAERYVLREDYTVVDLL